jgi:hypothetical protein
MIIFLEKATDAITSLIVQNVVLLILSFVKPDAFSTKPFSISNTL